MQSVYRVGGGAGILTQLGDLRGAENVARYHQGLYLACKSGLGTAPIGQDVLWRQDGRDAQQNLMRYVRTGL